MSWIVDHAGTLYILLAILAAGFVVIWRFDQRVKFLGYAGGVLVVIGLLWLLTQIVVTDRAQIRANVEAMADAVKAGNADDLFKHVSDDFEYKTMKRDTVYQLVRSSIKKHRITGIRIVKFEPEDISRSKKRAIVRIQGNITSPEIEQVYPFSMQMTFVLDGENWKLKTMKRYKYFVDTNQEIELLSPQ